jgi:aspartate dehydrogenase
LIAAWSQGCYAAQAKGLDMQGERRKLAIAGLGSVGFSVAKAIDEGLPGWQLVAVSANDRTAAAQRIKTLRNAVPVVPLEQLVEMADCVVECLPSSLFRSACLPFLEAGKSVVCLSVGALLENDDLIELARTTGGQMFVPSGGIAGLDAVLAAAEGKIESVTVITRRPIGGLAGAPALAGIDFANQTSPIRVFQGTAREAIKGFPANTNVVAAVSFAGIGPDRTRLEIWADPGVERNIHEVVLRADSTTLRLSIENVPSENPKTARIAALSVIACLRKMSSNLRIGT